MGNLAIEGYDYREPRELGEIQINFDYPGRGNQLLWDGPSMKITKFRAARFNFVKRSYQKDIHCKSKGL